MHFFSQSGNFVVVVLKDCCAYRAKKEKKTFGALVIEILEQAATA